MELCVLPICKSDLSRSAKNSYKYKRKRAYFAEVEVLQICNSSNCHKKTLFYAEGRSSVGSLTSVQWVVSYTQTGERGNQKRKIIYK
jgi:hypothetical protein